MMRGIGLAKLAMDLAVTRHLGEGAFWSLINGPVSRETAERDPGIYNLSSQYYIIIDRITRGENP